MIRWVLILIAALWMVILPFGYANSQDLQSIPESQRVVDQTGTLTAQQVETLATKLKQVREANDIVIAVLIVPTTQPEDIFAFSQRTFDQWKVGNKLSDNGLLIVLAKNDRKIRIHTGYGVENTITDAKAKQIISNQLAPNFKRGQFYQGFVEAVDEIERQTKKVPVYAPPMPIKPASGSEHILFFSLGIIVLFIIALAGGLWLNARKKRREDEEAERMREHVRRTYSYTPPTPTPVRRTAATSQRRRDDDDVTPVVVVTPTPTYRSSPSPSPSPSIDTSWSSGDIGGSSGGGGASGDY